jgi:hypothetical protein
MSVDENAPDIDITNIVSTGMKRKLKKKLKRLQGQDLDDDEIFHGLQKAQRKIHKSHDRTLFGGTSGLVDRRKKRMSKLKANRVKQKNQILQKME